MAEPDDGIESEEHLIATYFAPLAARFAGAFRLQDDCATLTPEPGRDLVLTTDAIAAGVHFLPDDPPEDIAWKALAVNVSDLAGKAATPIGYLLSLAFPEAPSRSWMDRFTAGLRGAQTAFAIELIGGDTDRRKNAPLSVTVMAIGSVPTGRMVRRQTAKSGDLIYVTGTLGDSALGLRLRTGELSAPAAGILSPTERAWLEGRYLRPQPRIGLREALLAHAHAAMDLSDGLAKDLKRLCRASSLAAEVRSADLPLSEPAQQLISHAPDLRQLALTGGDDYEILACVPRDKAAAFEALARDGGLAVTAIGRLQPGTGVTVLDTDGRTMSLLRPGYDHFS